MPLDQKTSVPAHEAAAQQLSIPEWDKSAASTVELQTSDGQAVTTAGIAKSTLRDRFDAVLPPNRTYLGLKRRWCLLAVLGIFLALLAFIIGLAVGLTTHGNSSNDLPLPTNSQTFTGDLTYYAPGLGACGIDSTSSDDIVAVSYIIFDAASTGSDPNDNPLCGRRIRAMRYDDQVGADRSVDLKVVDRCTGCAATDLDVSPAAFDQMAAAASGRVDVTWAWLGSTPTTT